MQNRCLIKGVLINLVGQKEKIKRIDNAHKGTLQEIEITGSEKESNRPFYSCLLSYQPLI